VRPSVENFPNWAALNSIIAEDEQQLIWAGVEQVKLNGIAGSMRVSLRWNIDEMTSSRERRGESIFREGTEAEQD
jgi:hypothetical protein